MIMAMAMAERSDNNDHAMAKKVRTQSPAHALIPWHSWHSWECPYDFNYDASYNYVYTH